MALLNFLILRRLAQRGLALRDAAEDGGSLRRRRALIQPPGGLITASSAETMK